MGDPPPPPELRDLGLPPTQPGVQDVQGKTRTWFLRPPAIAGAALVVVGVLALLLFLVHPAGLLASKHTLKGSVMISDLSALTGGTISSIAGDQHNCYGTGGYSDISSGGQVTVKDQAGGIIGAASLASGTGQTPYDCTLTFQLEVPDSAFYQITVGHRNALSYSLDDLKKMNWTVQLSLQ